MAVESNRHLETVFWAAVEIDDPVERADYLVRACGDDALLRAKVDRLVADHFRVGAFLERPDALIPPTLSAPVGERLGNCIGRYKLLEQIGEAAGGSSSWRSKWSRSAGRSR